MTSSLSAQQIYEIFHNGPGTAMWEAAQAATDQLSRSMPSLAADIDRLQDTMRAAWQGGAADMATQGAEPLALEYMYIGDALRSAQDLVGRQTASFNTAKQSVMPVPPQPAAVDAIGAMLGSPTMQQQLVQHLAASQHNVNVYNAYHGDSSYNTEQLPTTFGHLNAGNSTVMVTPTPMSTSAATRVTPLAGPVDTPNTAGEEKPKIEDEGHTRPIHTSTHTLTAAGGTAGLATKTAAAQPTGPIAPVSTSPSRAGTGVSSVLVPTASTGSDHALPIPTTPAGVIGFPDSAWQTTSDFGPIGDGSTPFGTTGPIIDGTASPQGTAMPLGTEVPVGSNPGRPVTGRPIGNVEVEPVNQSIPQRSALAAARQPEDELPFLPMAAGRGKRDDDEEHRVASYLQPADPNEFFGATQNAVRPVIGD